MFSMKVKRFVRSKTATVLYVLVTTLIAIGAKASEPPRLYVKTPAGTKVSAVDFKKSKKSAWHCAAVKIGPKGNWNAVPGAPVTILQTVPESEAAAEDGTKAVRCQLKIYNLEKHKVSNADLGDEAV